MRWDNFALTAMHMLVKQTHSKLTRLCSLTALCMLPPSYLKFTKAKNTCTTEAKKGGDGQTGEKKGWVQGGSQQVFPWE